MVFIAVPKISLPILLPLAIKFIRLIFGLCFFISRSPELMATAASAIAPNDEKMATATAIIG